MAQPQRAEAPIKPDLRIAAALSASLEVVRRRWLTLGLLTAVLLLAPDIVTWIWRGTAPTYLSLMPQDARLAYMAVSFLLTALYGVYATRVTLADQLEKRRMSAREAVAVPASLLPAVIAATFAGYLPLWVSNSLFPLGGLPLPAYLAGSLALLFGVSVALAFVGAAVAIIADERLAGLRPLARALEVTRGHRLGLTITIFAFNAGWFLIQYTVSQAVDLVVIRFTLRDADRLFWGAVAWEPFNIVQSMLWPVWMGVLYIALRRAREGVSSAGDLALFD
jgi:hypothetical protein